MQLETIELAEGSRVEQQLDALARRQLAALVLALDPLRAPAELRLGVQLIELLDFLFDGQAQYSFCACRDVIAAMLTMSSTVAVG